MILTALAVLVVSADPAVPARPVKKVESVMGKAVTVKGKLEDGSKLEYKRI